MNPTRIVIENSHMTHRQRAGFLTRLISLSFGVTACALAQPCFAFVYTKSNGGVDASGGSYYSVPLSAPPGTAGMEPKVSLDYSSQNGNGQVGIGWSLSGLSAITRCPKTLAIDGAVGVVNLDAADRFCLDGKRLVCVGSGTYGADATEYRTEIESFRKVISYGVAGSGPAWFKVWTRTGLILEYGNSTDSRVEAAGSETARLWAVNKVTDGSGNYYNVGYVEDATSGEFAPSRIDYTGNVGAGLAPYNSIRFSFEARPDIDTYYVGPAAVRQQKRLSSISTYADDVLVKDFRLSHETAPVSGKSRLASITECAGDGTCLPSLAFAYSTGGGGITQAGSTISALGNLAAAPSAVLKGDFNGDGVQDVWISDLAGNGRACFGPTFAQCTTAWHHDAIRGIHALDFNGDGVADIAVHYADGSLYFCAGPTFPPNASTCTLASGATFAGWDFVVGDFSGDGRDDLYGWNAANPASSGRFCNVATLIAGGQCGPGGPTGAGRRVVKGDFDGDGRIDLVFIGTTSYTTCSGRFLSTTGGNRGQCTDVPLAWNWRDESTAIAGDFNGDSKADLLLVASTGLQFCPAPGFMTANNCVAVSNTAGDWNATYQSAAGDFNADGYEDLFLAGPGGTLLCPGPGITTSNDCVPVNDASWRNARILAADFNGDASADILVVDLNSMKLAAGASTLPDLLLQATNRAFDTARSFTYKPLTDGSVYTKGSGAQYPLQDTRTPLYVVSQFRYPNGVGATNAKDFTYEKGRFSLDGRGFLGFEVTREKEGASDRETITTRAQTFPHFGRVTEVATQVGRTLARKHVRTLGTMTSFEGRPYSGLVAETISQRGLDGIWTSESIGYGYDRSGFGNLQGANYCRDEFSCPTLKRAEVSYFQNDPTQWLIGQPLGAQRQYRDAQGNAVFQDVDFVPVPGTRLVQQETRESRDTTLRLVTDYVRDPFGNVISATISGNGIESRTSATSYDPRGRFPTGSTNALGHVTTRDYDARFGIATRETDPNNLTTRWQLDAFGRRIGETRPDSAQTAWTYEICCPGYAMNPNLAYRVRTTTTGNAQPTYTYFDALDREVLSVRRNFPDTDWIDDRNIWYDAQGKVARAYLPYEQAAATKPYVSSSFDDLGRLSTRTAPDGGVTTFAYSSPSGPGPTTTTVTNARGYTTKYVTSVRNELLQVIDANNKATSYEYSPLGKIARIIDAKGNPTTIAYNKYGLMTSRNDPDLGAWTYTYDRLLQLASQTDAKGQVASFSYDKLGRKTLRTEPGMSATWTWDAGSKAVGKIASAATNAGVNRAYLYDNVGRPSVETLTIDAIAYPMTIGYDAAGRLDTLSYPTGFTVRNAYNGVGYLAEVRNAATNALFWKAVSVLPTGGVADEDYGNGTGVVRTFDPNTGRIVQIGTLRDSDGSLLQNFTYGYDLTGNMTSRAETTQGVSETYAYDALNRLTGVTSGRGKSYAYDEIGNVTYRSDVGAYTYPASGKVHAASSVAGVGYLYDLNGNLLSAGNKTFTWKSFNLPATAQIGAAAYGWSYDSDRGRVKRVAPAEATTYVSRGNSPMLEKIVRAGVTEQKHHIYAGGRRVALHTQRSTGSDDTRYIYRDHLGSTTLAADESGAVAERLSYDAQGKRRFASGSDDAGNTLAGTATDRGYTGHEHLDEMGLIHMNGRLYDPRIGRFISADPVIPDVADPQSLNRFAYALNNPLAYTDPDGHSTAATAEGTVDGVDAQNGRELITEPPGSDPPIPEIVYPDDFQEPSPDRAPYRDALRWIMDWIFELRRLAGSPVVVARKVPELAPGGIRNRLPVDPCSVTGECDALPGAVAIPLPGMASLDVAGTTPRPPIAAIGVPQPIGGGTPIPTPPAGSIAPGPIVDWLPRKKCPTCALQ